MIDALGLRNPSGDQLPAVARSRLWRRVEVLSRRREHRSDLHWKHARWSLANGLTGARALIATAILGVAASDGSRLLLVIGLSASWIGDMVDGHVARSRECETVLGAQIDGLADRLTALLVIVGAVIIDHGSAITVAAGGAAWLQFGMLDHALSSQFIRNDRWSPDELHLDDVRAWRVNWAPLAKVISNLPVGLLAIGGIATWVALACAVALMAIRADSFLRLLAGSEGRERETPRASRAQGLTAQRPPLHAAPDVEPGHEEARLSA